MPWSLQGQKCVPETSKNPKNETCEQDENKLCLWVLLNSKVFCCECRSLQQYEKILTSSHRQDVRCLESGCQVRGKQPFAGPPSLLLGFDMTYGKLTLINNHPMMLYPLYVKSEPAHLLTQHTGLSYLVHSAMPGATQMKEAAPVKQTGTVIN